MFGFEMLEMDRSNTAITHPKAFSLGVVLLLVAIATLMVFTAAVKAAPAEAEHAATETCYSDAYDRSFEICVNSPVDGGTSAKAAQIALTDFICYSDAHDRTYEICLYSPADGAVELISLTLINRVPVQLSVLASDQGISVEL